MIQPSRQRCCCCCLSSQFPFTSRSRSPAGRCCSSTAQTRQRYTIPVSAPAFPLSNSRHQARLQCRPPARAPWRLARGVRPPQGPKTSFPCMRNGLTLNFQFSVTPCPPEDRVALRALQPRQPVHRTRERLPSPRPGTRPALGGDEQSGLRVVRLCTARETAGERRAT